MDSPVNGKPMKRVKIYCSIVYRSTRIGFHQEAWYDTDCREYFTDEIMDEKNMAAVENAYYEIIQRTK